MSNLTTGPANGLKQRGVNIPVNMAPQAFLGQGLAFPFRMNHQGGLELSAAEQNIRESIWTILLTHVGERVTRPSFGCRLTELTFAPLNAETLMLMRIWVQEALEEWEPRIAIDQVQAIPHHATGRVDIVLRYKLHTTHQQRSLVYPFYLQKSE